MFLALRLLSALLTASIFTCVQAQPVVQAMVPTLIPVAQKARDSLLSQHPKMTSYEIEHEIRDATKKAQDAVKTAIDVPAGRTSLATLEPTFGSLREIPSIPFHRQLAVFAAMQGDTDDQMYHRAYAVALMWLISTKGDGHSPATAFRVVMVGEEYDWFFFNQQTVQPQHQALVQIDGKHFDVWTVKNISDNTEGQIYFDVSELINGFQTNGRYGQ